MIAATMTSDQEGEWRAFVARCASAITARASTLGGLVRLCRLQVAAANEAAACRAGLELESAVRRLGPVAEGLDRDILPFAPPSPGRN